MGYSFCMTHTRGRLCSRTSSTWHWLLSLLFVFVSAQTLPALTSVKTMSLPEMAGHADRVCWATIASVTPRWATAPNGIRHIESVVRLTQVDFLKGAGDERAAGPAADQADAARASGFEFIVPGGTLDGLTSRVAGAPEFAEGERWLLFLLPEWRVHPCVGIWQGAFRIAEDATTATVHGWGGAVSGVDAEGFPIFTHAASGASAACSACTVKAPGSTVVCRTHTGENASPLPLSAWRRLVEPIVTASAPPQCDPTRDRGARVWPSGKVVPLRAATTTVEGAP